MEFMIRGLLIVVALTAIIFVAWHLYSDWRQMQKAKCAHKQFIQMIRENQKALDEEKEKILQKHPEWRGKDWSKR